jgi:hypothetical protein
MRQSDTVAELDEAVEENCQLGLSSDAVMRMYMMIAYVFTNPDPSP